MNSATSKRRVLTILLGAVLLSAVLVAVVSQVNSLGKAVQDRRLQSLLGDLQTGTYDLLEVTEQAATGDAAAFERLPELDALLSEAGNQLRAGAFELSTSTLQPFDTDVQRLRSGVQSLVNQREAVLFLYSQGEMLEQNIPQIQQAYNTVTDVMLRTGVPAAQVAEAKEQVWRAETMLAGLRNILAGIGDSQVNAENFRQSVLLFTNVLNGMLEGDRLLGIDRVASVDARNSLQQVRTQFAETNQSAQLVLDSAPDLVLARAASDEIIETAPRFLATLDALSDEINALAGSRPFSTQWALFAVAAAVAALFMLGILVYLGTRTNLRVTEEANARNQQAILRLLDEIADLGEGDLTVRATVTEDFTGAIADSINFAVEQLRELVSRVVATAESVVTSSNRTRATSLQLSEAAEHQVEEVTRATAAIQKIAANLRDVSKQAVESASEAERSVEIAGKGSSVVRNTIDGMNDIREQIQDTSKRIKRLGESSQEIGDIVSLIDEIADQTNILALNASIQAAMAGEAGRGFAVVADEVQRLAERAAASTRQIETLVKTIQTDTNEAVASMEQTTTEVVRGANLANDAGTALDEIESGSRALAQLILSISNAAQEQSSQADEVAESMNTIQEISNQALQGTAETAERVGDLAGQATRLRESVADFKLPAALIPDSTDEDEIPAQDATAKENDYADAASTGFSADRMRDDLQAIGVATADREKADPSPDSKGEPEPDRQRA